MPRPKNIRKISHLPTVTFFKPAGVRTKDLQIITLSYDEVEALRLNYHLSLPQKQSANKMEISQSTFHRLVENANKKLANALISGKAIKIEGGHYKMVNDLKNLIIAIPLKNNSIDSEIESNFGRSSFFLIANIQDGKMKNYEIIDNIHCNSTKAVGILTTQMIAKKNVNVVICDIIGPKASDLLKKINIHIIQATGKAKKAIDHYLNHKELGLL
ncbi:MAG: DUF134 domain-containing protein [Parachlamydiales bacterium]|nr:DUF134 domain-containing protein [Parachlamydiales bacterium]